MRSHLTTLLAAGGALSLAAAALTATESAAASPTPSHVSSASTQHHKKATGLAFSHEVVVDEQRSGFEPDILTDSKDRMYTSVPNGSSQGTSFVWVSHDHGKTFQLVPGSVLQGKPETCNGGGDTELQLDTKDNLFLSDLQNLTNLSNSVTKDQGKTWSTTCVGATNTPVDRMWYAVKGALSDPHFVIYEEYDAVESGGDPANPAGNQLVEEVSHDGVNFIPVTNPNFANGCLGGGAANCVSNDEGISGNQLVTPSGDVFIAHSSADGNGVIVSHSKPKNTFAGGNLVSSTATWSSKTVNKSLCPDKASSTKKGICGSTQFATIARDSSGTLYVSFSSRGIKSDPNLGSVQTSPYNVYVVHSTNNGKTWSKPQRVSKGGSNSFSWVTAGSKGRAAMAWYHADQQRGKKSSSDPQGYTFDSLTNAEFGVQVAESTNALSRHAKYTVKTVSEHPIKYGPICTGGLGCTVSGGDRSLGDFLEVGHDRRGGMTFSYVDDTSNTYTTGATGFAENGPPVVVRQIRGPSLIKGKANRKGRITGPGKGPGRPVKKVKDAPKDSFYSANGARTRTGSNLDLKGSSLTTDKTGLVARMKLASLKSLATSTGDGGTTAEWIVRFTTYNPHTKGNGHIYYAGMESVSGGKPVFYDGDTTAPTQQVQLSQDFSSAHHTKGAYSAKTRRIIIHVPFKDVPGVKNHHLLYSATAFTGTTSASLADPNETGISGQINLTDATAPYDYRVKKPKTKHKHVAAAAAAASVTPAGSHVRRDVGGPLAGLGVLLLAAAGVRLLRRRRLTVLAH